jgi:glycosyltransferase involved in cell wall biosynthesis
VICTKDRPENLARCLRGLSRLEVPPGARWPEFLVVDNASDDDRTMALVASMPDVQYTLEPKPGLDFARNKALQEAQGDLLAFLDE